ncbi:MAG: hypothetical protein ACJ72N_27515 [Labedaea sp.]
MTDETNNPQKPTGSAPWYAGFVVALGVSVDTSWRFFGERLGVTDTAERALLFGVVEVMLLAAAWSMRAGVRRSGHPGSARFVAWTLCGIQAYMALELSGPAIGLARVVLGSGLALVALHQALGIEIKTRIGQRAGTMARIGREMRERALSRLGLGDDSRDAKLRSQERAAIQAATIATATEVNYRKLRKRVLKAGPAQRALIMDTVAALRSLDRLVDMDVVDSPWTLSTPVPSVPSTPRPRPANRPTSGGPAIGWDLDKTVAMMLKGEDVAGLVSTKNAQRVRRVLALLAAMQTDAEIVRGDITLTFVQKIRAARLKAYEQEMA